MLTSRGRCRVSGSRAGGSRSPDPSPWWSGCTGPGSPSGRASRWVWGGRRWSDLRRARCFLQSIKTSLVDKFHSMSGHFTWGELELLQKQDIPPSPGQVVSSGHAHHATTHHHSVRLSAEAGAEIFKTKMGDRILMASAKVWLYKVQKLNKSMSPVEIAFCLGSSVVSRLACCVSKAARRFQFTIIISDSALAWLSSMFQPAIFIGMDFNKTFV